MRVGASARPQMARRVSHDPRAWLAVAYGSAYGSAHVACGCTPWQAARKELVEGILQYYGTQVRGARVPRSWPDGQGGVECRRAAGRARRGRAGRAGRVRAFRSFHFRSRQHEPSPRGTGLRLRFLERVERSAEIDM